MFDVAEHEQSFTRVTRLVGSADLCEKSRPFKKNVEVKLGAAPLSEGRWLQSLSKGTPLMQYVQEGTQSDLFNLGKKILTLYSDTPKIKTIRRQVYLDLRYRKWQ